MTSPRPGALVISLDFELHWGVRDQLAVADYRENLLGVREAIPQMLELFRAHGVHATWATVGFLFFATKAELMAALPARLPRYEDPRLSPYQEIESIGASEAVDPFHYGAEMLKLIRATPGQEIATHTFSHYFCLERGQRIEEFEADLAAARAAARNSGSEVTSLVFPRNQFNPAYLEACRRAGITAYRGNQRSPFYEASDTVSDANPIKRGMRLADAYLPLTGLSARPREEMVADAGLVDVGASRFLRPYSRAFALFEGVRLRRIEREMTKAAERGLVYHLWWHPHNFGANTGANIAALGRLLRHFDALRQEHGMESCTMAELAAEALARAASTSRSSEPVNATA